jgi:hypothetical protein
MSSRKLPLVLIAVLIGVGLGAQFAPAGAAGKRRPSVRVAPNDPPIGVTIDTLGAQGAITIAGQAYGGSGVVSDLAYVVLDRTTRAAVESGNVDGSEQGIRALANTANKYSGGLKYLMIISGRESPPPDSAGLFFPLLKKLGAPLLTLSQIQDLNEQRSPFSIIGIPGAPAGGATLRIPGRPDPDQVSGAITGYLQKNQAVDVDGTPIYDYVSPEHPAFDTRAAGGTATSNVMTVGDKRYEASIAGIRDATAGFHVLVLDSLTLRALHNEALVTNANGAIFTDRQLQGGAGDFLRRWFDAPSGMAGPAQPDVTVLVQTIGKPKAAGYEWAGIVEQLARLGANRLDLNALDGTSEYSIVGGLGSQLPPAESTTAYDHGPYPAPNLPPARLVGVLARTRSSTFEPTVSGTPGTANPSDSVNLGLIKVAYQPLQAWPELAPGQPRDGVAAAQDFICRALNFCQATDSCPDVRSCYWQKYSADWGLKQTVLAALEYPGPGRGFTENTYKAVRRELLPEIAAVANLQSYLNRLAEPFDRSALRSYVDLQKIGKEIYDSVQPSPVNNSTSFALGVVSNILKLGAFAGPPLSAAAGGLSGAFALAAYLSDKRGQPILGGEITAKTSELADQLLDRFDSARKELFGLGQLIVSDYGKLMDANTHIDSDWSLPNNPSVAADALRTAAQQWFYQALVPVAYPYLIRGNSFNARYLRCTESTHWPAQPDVDQMQATVGYDGNGNPIKAIFFFTRGVGGGSSPPATLGDKMFAPRGIGSSALGIDKLSFFTPSVFRGIVHAVSGTSKCSVGWLPLIQ